MNVLDIYKLYGARVAKRVERGDDEDMAIQETIDQLIGEVPELDGDPRGAASSVLTGWLWIKSGLPFVVVGQKLAASLMSSAPSPNSNDLRLPWPAFLIEVPSGLIPGDEYLAVGVLTDRMVGNDIYMAVLLERSGSLTYKHAPTMDLLIREAKVGDPIERLLFNFLFGVIYELDNVGPQPQSRSVDRKERERQRRMGKLPAAWTFRITRDVKIDCRPWVQSYVATGGASPAMPNAPPILGADGKPSLDAKGRSVGVQYFTRGHWQRYATGAGRKNRTWIHKEPFWSNDPDLPIAQRRHVVR